MKVTATILQRKIDYVNKWLEKNPKTADSYNQQVQKRSYYVKKICQLHDENLETITI